jgi:hypothetical protein
MPVMPLQPSVNKGFCGRPVAGHLGLEPTVGRVSKVLAFADSTGVQSATGQGKTGAKTQCHVCQKTLATSQMRPWFSVRPGVSEMINAARPGWETGKHMGRRDLASFRGAYIEAVLEKERGELHELDRQIIESLKSGQRISQNPFDDDVEQGSFGKRMADHVASFGGSWTF